MSDDNILFVSRQGTIAIEWFDAVVWDAGHYGSEGKHAIVSYPGSKWLVVDSVYSAYESKKPQTLLYVGIHYDGDYLNAVRVDPKEFEPLADGQKLSDDLYRRHKKSHRIALRRSTNSDLESQIRDAEERAMAYLMLARDIKANPDQKRFTASYGSYVVGYVRP